MSDDRDNSKVEGSATATPFSRRKLVYAAPALMSRRIFYSQTTCSKAGGQNQECRSLPGTS